MESSELISVPLGHANYQILNRPMSWFDARDYAAYDGWILASIPDRPTNVHLTQMLKDNGIWGAWIGLTDEANEGTWRWINGEPVGFLAWDSNEPNDSHKDQPNGEDYAALTANGAWTDTDGYKLWPAIIQPK
jgi:hypothetical protein